MGSVLRRLLGGLCSHLVKPIKQEQVVAVLQLLLDVVQGLRLREAIALFPHSRSEFEQVTVSRASKRR